MKKNLKTLSKKKKPTTKNHLGRLAEQGGTEIGAVLLPGKAKSSQFPIV